MTAPDKIACANLEGAPVGETQAELVDRRGREAEARHARDWAKVEARRAAGIPDEPCALPPAFGPSVQDVANGAKR